jgi:hypothetical protein
MIVAECVAHIIQCFARHYLKNRSEMISPLLTFSVSDKVDDNSGLLDFFRSFRLPAMLFEVRLRVQQIDVSSHCILSIAFAICAG